MKIQNIYFDIIKDYPSELPDILNNYDKEHSNRKIIDADIVLRDIYAFAWIKYKLSPEYIEQIEEKEKQKKEQCILAKELQERFLEYLKVNNIKQHGFTTRILGVLQRNYINYFELQDFYENRTYYPWRGAGTKMISFLMDFYKWEEREMAKRIKKN